MKTDTEYDELNLYDINSIFNFITKNYVQVFLLFLVVAIIYVVDRISNFNAMIFAIHSPIPGIQPQIKNEQPQKQKKLQDKFNKKNKNIKK
jgi:hypothetical protein